MKDTSSSKFPYKLVILLTSLNMLNYMDRYLVQAVQPILAKDMSLNLQESGFLISAFVIGYLIFSPIFGYFGDRYPRPLLMAFGGWLWSLATVATGCTSALVTFALARVSVGIGEASFGTLGPGYLKDRIQSVTSLNLAFAAFFSAIPVGSALGYVFGGVVASSLSWHWVFFLGGIPGLILATFLLKLPEVRPVRSKEEMPRFWQTLPILSKRKVLMLAIAGYIFNNFALTGVGAFIAQYGVNIGYQLSEITTRFGVILVVSGLIGTFGGGKLSSYFAQKSKNPVRALLLFVAITSLCGVSISCAAVMTTNQTWFLILSFIAELCVFAGVAPINSVIVLSSPANLVSFVQGMTIAAINLFGSFLSPILVGRISDQWGLSWGLELCAVALLCSAVLWGIAGFVSKKPSCCLSDK